MRPIDHDTNVQGSPLPLRQDYQRFLLLGSRRAPHTLYMHERGYRSGTINTDSHGMRYSHCADRRCSVTEHSGVKRVNLLVGGSTTLGIGASSDKHDRLLPVGADRRGLAEPGRLRPQCHSGTADVPDPPTSLHRGRPRSRTQRPEHLGTRGVGRSAGGRSRTRARPGLP